MLTFDEYGYPVQVCISELKKVFGAHIKFCPSDLMSSIRLEVAAEEIPLVLLFA